jgi:hypothetical protein
MNVLTGNFRRNGEYDVIQGRLPNRGGHLKAGEDIATLPVAMGDSQGDYQVGSGRRAMCIMSALCL